MEIKVSENLKKLSKLLDGKLYIVGGYVRNSLLNLSCDDIDICSPFVSDEVKNRCADSGFRCKMINEKLGTLLITAPNDEKYEYTPFRSENYVRGNHAPENVQFVDDIFVDAKRRDFTINCIYYNVATEKIFDPYYGVGDIKKGVVKCVETPLFVFSSDGLRILRLVRLACELGFKIDAKTFKTASEMSYQLRDISAERKYAELKKIALAEFKYGKKPNNFIHYLNGLNIYKYLLGFGNEKFELSTKNKEYLRFLNCGRDEKFVAFLVLVLLNKYEHGFMQEGQVNCDVMMLSNYLRMPKNVSVQLNKVYLVVQQLLFKPLNEFVAINYHNLADEERAVVNVFCDPRAVSEVILGLKMNGVPLGIKNLNISAEEIGQIVSEEKISQVQKLLFEMCLKGVVKNEKTELIKVIKTIKFK